jgi:hypothetical protein
MKRFLTIVAALMLATIFTSTASASWTRLGGDPLVRGGVNSRNSYVHIITSKKGNTAMAYAGLNKAQRKAVVMGARTGKFKSCVMHYGDFFLKMSFGINGTSVDSNVTFADARYRAHGAASWCQHSVYAKKTTVKKGKEKLVKTVVHKDGSKDLFYDRVDTKKSSQRFVDSLMPRICGNFAVVRFGGTSSVKMIHHRRRVHVPPPTVNKAHANLTKAVYLDGSSVTLTGGEFSFDEYVNGSKLATPVTNAASGTSRDLGQFDPGAVVKVCETQTGGYTPDQTCISHTMATAETFTFSFINRKVSPPPPVQHTCTLSVSPADKSAPYTANASVVTDVTPSSVTWGWGDGVVQVNGTSASHTYAVPTAGPAGTGVTYQITAKALFGSTTVECGSTSFFVPAPPPNKAHANLTKAAYLDGNSVTLAGGEFTFDEYVNGSKVTTVTNTASGTSRDLGLFDPDAVVKVCETQTGGYTPDQTCISHTMAAGETFVFSFINRKTTPPAVHHSCTASVSNLQKDERTATFTVTCDGPIASAIWSFSGASGNATGTTVTRTFPDSEAGHTATGTVTVYFSDSAPSVTASVGIDIPALPPDGNPGVPPKA